LYAVGFSFTGNVSIVYSFAIFPLRQNLLPDSREPLYWAARRKEKRFQCRFEFFRRLHVVVSQYIEWLGAVCVSSARTDLCRKCRVTGIPTAIEMIITDQQMTEFAGKRLLLNTYNYRSNCCLHPGIRRRRHSTTLAPQDAVSPPSMGSATPLRKAASSEAR